MCASKNTARKLKRQPAGREKIFANHIFYKGLVSSIYKELLQFNEKNIPFGQMMWMSICPKGDLQAAGRHVKRHQKHGHVREL